LSGKEDYILVDNAEYPKSLFLEDNGLLDIHAGAFETAAIKYFYKQILNIEAVKNLPVYSLNYRNIKKWLQGGESARNVVPLGYAGNPSEYEKKLSSIEAMFSILCKYVAEVIML